MSDRSKANQFQSIRDMIAANRLPEAMKMLEELYAVRSMHLEEQNILTACKQRCPTHRDA
jgi:hypothetical protein